MNYYMNIGQFYTSEAGRKLYTEIGLIEEQHVTHYGSLKDPNATWLELWLMNEYTECYLYYSCMQDETDPNVKKIWQQHYEQELSHLYTVANLLKKFEKKEWNKVIPSAQFPKLLNFGSNIDYVRQVIKNSTTLTGDRTDYKDVSKLSNDHTFFQYQNIVNNDVNSVASHLVIDEHIAKHGTDYRFETTTHPIKELQDRKCDNTTIARTPSK